MTISQLKTFLAVCQTMSFTEAANQLYLSQTAVSRQMSALEREMKAILFERNHNSLHLTRAGQHLKSSLPKLLEELERVSGEVSALGNGSIGLLNIGIQSDQKLDNRFTCALRALRNQKVAIQLRYMDLPALMQGLADGTLDAALSLVVGNSSFPGCSRMKHSEEYACVAVHRLLLPDHIPIGDDKRVLDMIRSLCPILTPDMNRYYEIDSPELRSQEENNGRLDRLYESSEISPMVGAGLAATIANESHLLSANPELVLLPLKGLPKIMKAVYWMPDNSNPSLELLLEMLERS